MRSAERWRPAVGFDGYEVSDLGRVRSWKPRGPRVAAPVEPRIKAFDFAQVSLMLNGRLKGVKVHRLVLEAFVGPCPPGMEACHDPDPTRTNNALSNLRWDTKKANGQDRVRHGNQARPIGSSHPGARLNEQIVSTARARLASGESKESVGAALGITRGTMWNIANGRTWRHVA